MNKFLIVGQTDSGIADLASLLRCGGYHEALPSRRDPRRPEMFVEAMRRSLNLPESRMPRAEEAFEQVFPGQAWQIMGAEILTENDNQGPWFLSSPSCLPFLDFWTALDPELIVIMVYQGPVHMLGWEMESGVDDRDLDHRLDNWKAYHSAMLRYFLRNSERCLLVNRERVISDPESCLDLIVKRLGALSTCLSAVPAAPVADVTCFQIWRAERAARFLSAAAFARDPRFEPLEKKFEEVSSLAQDSERGIPSPLEALEDFLSLTDSIRELVKHQERDAAEQRFFKRQLLEVQESLEENYLETQGYKWRLLEAERELAAPRGAVELVKQQLAYRLGSALVMGSRSVIGVICVPLVVVIETSHFVLTKIRTRNVPVLPLREYADFKAAGRVKMQLSYRIGRTLLRNLKSPLGWFRLPSAISSEIVDFKRSRRAEAADTSALKSSGQTFH